MSLVQACQTHAEFRRSGTACIDGEIAWNWGEFVDRAARAAAGLAGLGVTPGKRVGILALNSADYLVAEVAAWWIGAVVVPMNIRWTAEENIYSAKDAGLAVLIADATFAEAAVAVAAAMPALKLVSFEHAPGPAFTPFESLIAENAPIAARDGSDGDLAGIYYTGGTTGFPKGVMLSHQAIAAASMGLLAVLDVSDQSRALHAAPMFHLADGALGHAMLLVGASNIYVPRFDPVGTIAVVEKLKPTHCLLVPTMIGMLLADESYAPARLASLETLLFGASPMNPAHLAKMQADLPALKLLHCYGQTEMGPLVSCLDPRHQRAGDPKALSIGKPFPSVEVRIVDDQNQAAAIGKPGEILARGPSMMSGYWNKPDETAKAMFEGWVRTGDIAYRDADGYMFICDRAKDMIITGGENVFSAEVENAISTHPAVAQVAVIGVPDNDFGERVHAVIVLRPDQTITQPDLFEHCRKLIANYKCPRSIELRNELPISGAGKILKRDLREPHWHGRERAIN